MWLPGSRLGRLIVGLNLLGLAILVVGALVLNEFRRSLVEAREDSLRTQGELIANVIAVGPPRARPSPCWSRSAPATCCRPCSFPGPSARACSTPTGG